MQILYQNRRTGRVRFLQLLLWGVSIASLIGALWGLAAADESWLVGAILAPIFVLFALGMEYYLRIYVTKLSADAEGLTIETMSTFGSARRRVPWSEVSLGGEIRDTSLDDEGPSISATADVLRVKGAVLLIDTTDDAFDSEGLRQFLPLTARG